MTEEFVTQADSIMGAFQQSWHFHHHEIVISDSDNTQDRFHRGKRVIGYLGFRRRTHRYQRGLACVGLSQQTDIRQ